MLSRILRAKVCDDPAAATGCQPSALALARRHRPRTYESSLRVLSGAAGELPFELEVGYDGRRLRSRRLRPLLGATLTSPAELVVQPPRDSETLAAPGEPGVVVARYRPGDPSWDEQSWTIDFQTLLAPTAW